MKRAKHYILLFATLFSFTILPAQKDSVQSLFKPVKLNIRYSNLQWEIGYHGFVFNNAYLQGYNIDFIGIVFNEVNFAIGIDGAGGRGGPGHNALPVQTTTVQSYSGFYFKIEPMLFPEKLINLSMPVKFGLSSLSYADTSTVITSRRRHRLGVSFPSITPGVFGYLNIFPNINLGVGLDYRFALSEKTPGIATSADYDNFSFYMLVRFRLYTRKKIGANANKGDYYAPPERFK
ncbi:MAG TPA: hypothetical protein VN922_22400 [Bacteroidia bacterium]|nr:hypothetical protein [Bacteroidia bacterium]